MTKVTLFLCRLCSAFRRPSFAQTLGAPLAAAQRGQARDTSAMPLSRQLAIAFVATGLSLLALSHYYYGLAAQQSVLLGIVPLLFSALLLGRRGLWVSAFICFGILLLGTWVDQQHEITLKTAFASLLQPSMEGLIMALVLDRLLVQLDANRRRSQDLALLCRQLEKEIQHKEHSQAQLVHSQRMDALGKLAGNVAHDFNNLLSVILGYATERNDAEHLQERMRGITVATRRGKQLTGKLMTLARATSPAREVVDINTLLNELQPMLAHMLGERIDIRMVLCAQPAWVNIDPAEFEASILNLAKNAGDAIAHEGVFRIETRLTENEVQLQIHDTGCGMSAEVAQQIFEPFFTTKPAHGGTGIGLAMVNRIMTDANGQIAVASTLGEGTRFLVQLPLQAAPASMPLA